MSIKELEYSKDWRNPADFSTYEGSEEKVREDMQFLFDEVKQYVNGELLPGMEGGIASLPAGGEKGQALMKQSSADGDVAWQYPPSGGGGGGGGGGGSGEDGATGGYYVPHVESGVLSWTASSDGMPDVPNSDIRGPEGPKGDTGATGPEGPKGDKGDKGDTGATGPQGAPGAQGAKGETGAQGPAGADGYTPQKGVDYWTDADKAAIAQEIAGALPVASATQLGLVKIGAGLSIDANGVLSALPDGDGVSY